MPQKYVLLPERLSFVFPEQYRESRIPEKRAWTWEIVDYEVAEREMLRSS